MSVPLHEVIEAFANTIEGQSGECVAELRDGSGRPLDIVSAMRDWADTLRTPHKPKRRPRYEYRFDRPDNFNYEEWIGSIGSDGWHLCAIDTDGTHVFARDARSVPPQAKKEGPKS